MPIAKQKLKELAQSLPNGVLSNGLTDSAANELNRLVDKIHSAFFPKGSSVELASVQRRVQSALQKLQDAGMQINAELCVLPNNIPLGTIKKMVREHAGDVKVPDDTLMELCGVLVALLKVVMENAAREITNGVAVLDGKHVKASLMVGHGNHALAALLVGAKSKRRSSSKKKSSKRRSSSKKRRSSSKKRCGRGKSAVKSFVRDGQRIKSYCRKKSPSR